MEVLNPSPVLCLPQAMWITCRVIMERPDLSQEEILDLVTPVAMRSRTPQDGAHVRRALTGLREFGLVQQGDNGLYRAEKVKDAQAFLRLLRHRLVAPPITLDSHLAGAPDLRSGLVWLMRQSPMIPLDFETNVAATMPSKLFTNDTRWNAFRWWSQTLGFSRPALTAMATGIGQKASVAKVVPNPTEAVIDAIRHPFGNQLTRGEQIPINQFLEFLRAELPVLPGHPSATYDGFVDDGNHGIGALGLALSSAEARQILSMGYQSDPSGVMALPDAQDHRRDRYVSAVTIEG